MGWCYNMVKNNSVLIKNIKGVREEINKCLKLVCFMEYGLQCTGVTTIRRIFMQNMEIIKQWY